MDDQAQRLTDVYSFICVNLFSSINDLQQKVKKLNEVLCRS